MTTSNQIRNSDNRFQGKSLVFSARHLEAAQNEAFTLWHTFSSEQFIWQLISNPKNLWFKSWQDEEEGVMVLGADEYVGFSPDGHIIKERTKDFKGLVSIATTFVVEKFIMEQGTYTWNDAQKTYILNGKTVKEWDETAVTGKVAVWRRSNHPECYTLYQFIPVQNYTKNDFESIKQQIDKLDNAKWIAEYVEGKMPACEELFKKEIKSILKGQEVISYLNRNGFSAYSDLVNEVGLLVSRNDAENMMTLSNSLSKDEDELKKDARSQQAEYIYCYPTSLNL
jgi:hypothetical protein